MAYTCKPVQQAFFLNVLKSKDVDFNPKLWAREDIDFNERTENLKKESLEKGHIVKCHRYVSVKKRVKEGGVVPAKSVPAEVMKLIEGHKKWATRVNTRQQQRSVMEIGKEQQNGGKRMKNEEESEYINIRAIACSATGRDEDVHLRIKKTEKLGNLFRSYSEVKRLPPFRLRFLYDGERLRRDGKACRYCRYICAIFSLAVLIVWLYTRKLAKDIVLLALC